MRFIADFHIHSHYSMATSKQLTPGYLDYWGKLKGIKVIGTGDFTHPGWTAELKEKLEPAEEGLFRLKNEYKLKKLFIPGNEKNDDVRFMLTAEISSIYKKGGKVRKVHNVLFAPSFETVDRLQQKLSGMNFNITSDGRPILGLDSRNLLELSLEVDEDIFFVPAHIWTPWFSVLGAKSGFDTVEECFDDLSHHIHAVETGLSSDPPLNWMCSSLDQYTLLANSDAHSPEKLGRNANIFNTELSYKSIIEAIKSRNPNHFLGTIDMYPQEGKYHYDGHRKCGVCWNPVETLENKGICPVCNRRVTIGVTNRIVQLSDRENIGESKNKMPFYSLIPLKEIIAEITGVGVNSKKVNKTYYQVLEKYGSEFDVLLNIPLDILKEPPLPLLDEAIRRMREKEVIIKEGFDGEYGVIKVFDEQELQNISQDKSLFHEPVVDYKRTIKPRPLFNFDLQKYQELSKTHSLIKEEPQKKTSTIYGLNSEQTKAASHIDGPAMILAGPGTGKTRVLTTRIANLVNNQSIKPENILAVTFTQKASGEMKERLKKLLENKSTFNKVHIHTFHSLGLNMLKKYYSETPGHKISIIDDADKENILYHHYGIPKNRIKKAIKTITSLKQSLQTIDIIEDPEQRELFKSYQGYLERNELHDLDDMIYEAYWLLKNNDKIRQQYRSQFQHILVDEYQDINYAQYQLINCLLEDASCPNLFIIGDPNQAIYGFRGADVSFIKRFTDDFPGAKVYKLGKSYRCSDRILEASGNVIYRRNTKSFLKGLNKGVKIKIVPAKTGKSEAEFIARKIEEMIGGLRFFSMDSSVANGEKTAGIESLGDFAVLCRTKSQFAVIEKAFNDHSIPYQVIGETPFFKRSPVKELIDILRFIHNPENSLIKEKIDSSVVNKIEENILSLQEQHATRIIEFVEKHFKKEEFEQNPLEFKKIKALAKSYKTLSSLITFVTLGKETDTLNEANESVPIMTIHASKGLEFKCVFIAGCEEGIIPYKLFSNSNSKIDLEEEKRLFYVGMTRAEKLLYLTHASKRYIKGKEYNYASSSFIDKIEKELLETEQQERKRKKAFHNQLSLFDS